MSSRMTGFWVAATAAAMVAGAAAPALAVTATAGSIGFAGLWSESGSGAAPAATTLTFSNLATLSAEGVFASFEAESVLALPLVLQETTVSGDSTLGLYAIDTASFTGEGWKRYANGAESIIFDLDLDATWLRTFDNLDGDVNFEQGQNGAGVFEYTGRYVLPDGGVLGGRGQLNASLAGASAIFEVTQTAAIPLPATAWLLLGGLAAAGALARRRAA